MLDLSEPILRYCTKDDIIDALLVPPIGAVLAGKDELSSERVRVCACVRGRRHQHEMIHAYLYLSGDPEWQGHGRSFLQLAECVSLSLIAHANKL
jgi:hypothetical protein